MSIIIYHYMKMLYLFKKWPHPLSLLLWIFSVILFCDSFLQLPLQYFFECFLLSVQKFLLVFCISCLNLSEDSRCNIMAWNCNWLCLRFSVLSDPCSMMQKSGMIKKWLHCWKIADKRDVGLILVYSRTSLNSKMEQLLQDFGNGKSKDDEIAFFFVRFTLVDWPAGKQLVFNWVGIPLSSELC